MSETREYEATGNRWFRQHEGELDMLYRFGHSNAVHSSTDQVQNHLLFEILLELRLIRNALENKP